MEIRPVSSPAPLFVVSEGGAAQLADGAIVSGKVLAVGPKGVEIAIAGREVTVRAEVPLSVGDQLALKVAMTSSGQMRLSILSLQGSEIGGDPNLAGLLADAGVPADRPHLAAARLLLAQTGSVDPASVRELMRQPPGDRPAAALLLAKRLPLSPMTLALAREQLDQAQAEAPDGNAGNAGAQWAKLLAESMNDPRTRQALAALWLPERADASYLANAVQTLAQVLTPPEAELAKSLVTGKAKPPSAKAKSESPLASDTDPEDTSSIEQRLAANLVTVLARALERPDQDAGQGRAPLRDPAAGSRAAEVSQRQDPGGGSAPQALLGRIRFQQMINAAPAEAGREIRLPLLFGKHHGELRVQRWSGGSSDSGGHTRIVVNLDMAKLGPVSVDVLYARGRLTGHVTVADLATATYLRNRLAELHQGLAGTGVSVGHLAVSTHEEAAARALEGPHFDFKL